MCIAHVVVLLYDYMAQIVCWRRSSASTRVSAWSSTSSSTSSMEPPWQGRVYVLLRIHSKELLFCWSLVLICFLWSLMQSWWSWAATPMFPAPIYHRRGEQPRSARMEYILMVIKRVKVGQAQQVERPFDGTIGRLGAKLFIQRNNRRVVELIGHV